MFPPEALEQELRAESSDQFTDRFKALGFRCFAPFEGNALCSANSGPCIPQAMHADFVVALVSAAGRIIGHEHSETTIHEIERGLQDAHVSFNADQDNLITAIVSVRCRIRIDANVFAE